MKARFSQSFKDQAVEKALNRRDISMLEIAQSLGIGKSTLEMWIRKSKSQTHVAFFEIKNSPANRADRERRPQDWTEEERLNMVIRCGSMSETELNQACREQGLYPHRIQQWKSELSDRLTMSNPDHNASEAKRLRAENKALKKELNRKEKALAEAAALLVLQKKVQSLLGNDEDNSL